MTHAAMGFPPDGVIGALAIVTLVTTVLSGADYVYAFTRRAWVAPANAS